MTIEIVVLRCAVPHTVPVFFNRILRGDCDFKGLRRTPMTIFIAIVRAAFCLNVFNWVVRLINVGVREG